MKKKIQKLFEKVFPVLVISYFTGVVTAHIYFKLYPEHLVKVTKFFNLIF